MFVFNAIKKIDMLYTILFIQNKSEHMQLDQIIFDTELVQPVVSGPRRDGGGGLDDEDRGPGPPLLPRGLLACNVIISLPIYSKFASL